MRSLAESILPHLRRLKQYDVGRCPYGFETSDEWRQAIDEMIFGLEFIDRSCTPLDDLGRAKAGLELLGKYFIFLSIHPQHGGQKEGVVMKLTELSIKARRVIKRLMRGKQPIDSTPKSTIEGLEQADVIYFGPILGQHNGYKLTPRGQELVDLSEW
jgi:hypothetical protein